MHVGGLNLKTTPYCATRIEKNENDDPLETCKNRVNIHAFIFVLLTDKYMERGNISSRSSFFLAILKHRGNG